MIRRFSIVLDPNSLAPLYIGADAEAAKQLIRQRKNSGEAVAGWINVRPEKRFTPSIKAESEEPSVEVIEPEETDEPEIDVESLIEIASGDGRKPEVKEARKTLDELGIEY
jgi:hypothetical protein